MNQVSKLQEFVVSLAISGVDKDADPKAMENFGEEVAMRRHLTLRQINFDNSTQQLKVSVVMESLNKEMAKKQMTEEFFEIANAVLQHIEGVTIKVEEVNLLQ